MHGKSHIFTLNNILEYQIEAMAQDQAQIISPKLNTFIDSKVKETVNGIKPLLGADDQKLTDE